LDDQHAARIARILAEPSWQWLTRAVRTAWETDLSRRRVRIDLDALDEAQVSAMANVLRWPTNNTGTVRVDLARLDTLLRTSGLRAGLVACLTVSGGPLHNDAGIRRAANSARHAAAERVWADAAAHPAIERHPRLRDWLTDERNVGRLPGDPATRSRILADALAVLLFVPHAGVGLSQLASRVLGHAHALDAGPVPATVLRALAWLGDVQAVPAAAERRMLWASAGVALDTVSSTVLSLGLTVAGNDATALTLAANSAAGLPVRLTLGQVQHHLLTPVVGPATAWVCENPSVVEAVAERLGPTCPPLVCVEGRPSVAANLLLTALHGTGTELRYHGDFDWAGLDIAAAVISAGARPWRMGAEDYLASVHGAHPNLPVLPPPGPNAASPWDERLVAVMRRTRRQLEEEHVLDDLLSDLAAARGRDNPL
jgi:uncharacterized protein (TIGR02679 family)